MNETQLAAATAVEHHKAEIRKLAKALTEAERALKRAEARLRTAIRKDPQSWNTVTPVPDQHVQ